MIPVPVHHHADLLTLNTKEQPLYKDAMPGVPGVDVQPLFLDPGQGV